MVRHRCGAGNPNRRRCAGQRRDARSPSCIVLVHLPALNSGFCPRWRHGLDQALAQQHRPTVVVPRRGMVLMAALIATFMAAVESTIVATAMPTIVGRSRRLSAVQLGVRRLSADAGGDDADLRPARRHLRPQARSSLSAPALSGRLDCCAASPGAWSCWSIFRAMQGIGAGAIQPIASTDRSATSTRRPSARGCRATVERVRRCGDHRPGARRLYRRRTCSWSLVFWINLPIGAVAIAMFAVYLPERVEPRQHRIDYLGVGLLMRRRRRADAGAGAGAHSRRRRHRRLHRRSAWRPGSRSSCTSARAPEPMVPFRLWRNRVIALGNLGSFAHRRDDDGGRRLSADLCAGGDGPQPGDRRAGARLPCRSAGRSPAFAAGRLMIRTSYRLAAALGGVALAIGSGDAEP